LYKLRACLGDDAPITQPALAKILDTSVKTLQALESEQRGAGGLSSALLQRIQQMTGAIWSPEEKQWLFDLRIFLRVPQDANPHVPFVRALYEQFHDMRERPSSKLKTEIDSLYARALVKYLFDCVPEELEIKLYLRICYFCETCCKEFGLGDAGKMSEAAAIEFDKTAGRLEKTKAVQNQGQHHARLAMEALERQISLTDLGDEKRKAMIEAYQMLWNLLSGWVAGVDSKGGVGDPRMNQAGNEQPASKPAKPYAAGRSGSKAVTRTR
jgi:hypothetical protein